MHEIIDLERYPLDRIDSQGRDLVERAALTWRVMVCSTWLG